MTESLLPGRPLPSYDDRKEVRALPAPADLASTLEAPWRGRLEGLQRWLLLEASRLPNVGAVVDALSQKLLEAEIPLVRSTTHIRVLHSERVGVTRIWYRDKPIREVFFPHGSETEEAYKRSPIKVVYETHEWLDFRIGNGTPDVYGLIPDLRAEGITHYVIGPMIFSNGVENAVSWSTDRPEGFDMTHLRFLYALLPALTPILELRAIHRILNEVLRIYVGQEPGTQILSGHVRRGDVRKIRSAILVCDMRHFSTITAGMAAEDAVALLNRYLDCVVPAVNESGGEVLKFMGDGVLAIFADPGTGSAEVANEALCEAAIDAAWTIRADLERLNAERPEGTPEIRVRLALHVGEAAYGNIGSGERLDFTVIGSDVNLASRINDLGSDLDRELLFSKAFVTAAGLTSVEDLGRFALKGFTEPQRVFGLKG